MITVFIVLYYSSLFRDFQYMNMIKVTLVIMESMGKIMLVVSFK